MGYVMSLIPEQWPILDPLNEQKVDAVKKSPNKRHKCVYDY